GFREFSHKRIDVYPAVLNRTEHVLGVKVDTKCEMKESYPDGTYKSFVVLMAKLLTKATIFNISQFKSPGVIYCGQEEEEAAIDIISTKYERYGNGVEAPEKLEIIKEKCNEIGHANSTGKL
ncbi:unnamed protein product, partial [Medioppia subpectinata]